MAVRVRRQVVVFSLALLFLYFIASMFLTKDNCSTAVRDLGKLETDTFNDPWNAWQKRADEQTSELSWKRFRDTPTDNSKSTSQFLPPTCLPRTKLALVKTHKTGGTTTMQLLHRYAYLRNLSVVLPNATHPGRMNAFYPHKLTTDRYLPPQHGDQYDMLTYHTVYDRDTYVKLVGQDAAFITILREPLSHIKSQFNFYNFVQRFNITGQDPFYRFLGNIGKYDKHGPSHLGSSSPMSVDLGMPKNVLSDITQHSSQREPGQPLNSTTVQYIQDFLKKLTREMDLVMITEYFDESLVMLKRLMCWELKDILYYKALSFEYATKEKLIHTNLVENHRKWDTVDYHLYEHFLTIFKQKEQELGPDFKSEVKNFKNINLKVKIRCRETGSKNREDLIIPETKWNRAFVITQEFCTMMKTGQLCYMTLLMDRNYSYRSKKKRISSVSNLYTSHYCTLCGRISKDCTLGEYVTHLIHENRILRADSSFSRNRHTVDGQNQEEFQT
ncbi:galactosylceramide sulfotransferase-like [Branchiostoma floridae x Branchiostoma belcheri]